MARKLRVKDLNDLPDALLKSVRSAIDKKAEKRIVPIVKNAYKRNAEKLTAMKKASTAKNVKASAIKREAYNIADVMSSDYYIKSTNVKNGEFSVYNDKQPQQPLWGSIHSTDKLLFTQWIVEGSLVIHPALTKYKNKDIAEVEGDPDAWQNYYIKNYRFERKPFVSSAIHELTRKKNNELTKEIANIVVEEITEELKK